MKKLALILLILSNFQCMLFKDSPLDPNGDLSLLRLLGMLSNRDRAAQPTVFLHAQVKDGVPNTLENFLAAYNPETNEFRYKTPNFNSYSYTDPDYSRFNIPMVSDPVRPIVYLYLSQDVSGSVFQHRIIKLDLTTGSILGEGLFPIRTEELIDSSNGIAYDPISDSIFFGVLTRYGNTNNYIYEIKATDLTLTKIHNIPRISSSTDAIRGGMVYHSENSTIDFFWFEYGSEYELYVNPFRVGYEIAPSNTIQVIPGFINLVASSLIPIYDSSQKRYLALDQLDDINLKLYRFNRENYIGDSGTPMTMASHPGTVHQTLYHPIRNSLFSFIEVSPSIQGVEISLETGSQVQSIPLESSLGTVAQGSHYIHPSSNRLYFVRESNIPDTLSCVNGVLDLNTNLTSYSSPFHRADTGNECRVKWVNYVE
jgi:hypothetical protein